MDPIPTRHHRKSPQAMTITQYRDRLARLTADLRVAQWNNNHDAIDRIRAEIDEAFDAYNRSHTCSD